MRPRSSPRPNRLSLQEDIPKTITKSPLCSVQSLPEVTNTNVNPSEVCDQIIEALSTTITSNRANVTLNTPKGAPSNSEYFRFIYSDLHKGQLDKFVECLDRSEIEKELSGLETYGEFRRAVEHLGHLSHFENWRNNERPDSCDFDVVQLKARLHDVEQSRHSRDPDKMLQLIRTQLSRFNSDIDQEILFHPFLHGTKKIIEEYTDSVCRLLENFTRLYARYGNESDRLRLAKQLEEVKISFGETALLCSGGGTYGMRHIGTIKCLFETGTLPHIMTGASAGSIVCAVLGSKTDDQLQQVLETFCHGDLKVFIGDHEPPGWWARMVYVCQNWHLFDAKNLARVMRFHLGDMTFSEAYRLTGRILNVSADP
jgi:TAG lipase/steryl ester hydrolase/phospholipase A2/LPA acyltransferase